jgi:hypothetical protein
MSASVSARTTSDGARSPDRQVPAPVAAGYGAPTEESTPRAADGRSDATKAARCHDISVNA